MQRENKAKRSSCTDAIKNGHLRLRVMCKICNYAEAVLKVKTKIHAKRKNWSWQSHLPVATKSDHLKLSHTI